MESGIDIKFPFCALAAAKLRKGRGIIIEEIPMMLSVRECHLNAAGHTEKQKPSWALMSVHIRPLKIVKRALEGLVTM